MQYVLQGTTKVRSGSCGRVWGRPDQTRQDPDLPARLARQGWLSKLEAAGGFNKTSSGDVRYMRCGGMRVYDQVPTVKQTSRGRFQKEGANGPITPWRQVLAHNVTVPTGHPKDGVREALNWNTSSSPGTVYICVVREEKTGWKRK